MPCWMRVGFPTWMAHSYEGRMPSLSLLAVFHLHLKTEYQFENLHPFGLSSKCGSIQFPFPFLTRRRCLTEIKTNPANKFFVLYEVAFLSLIYFGDIS